MDSHSLFRSSWAYVWSNNRKEVLRSFSGLLRDRPVFLFLTVACILRPTWWGFLVVPLAFVFSQMVIEIFSKQKALYTQSKIVTCFLNVIEDPGVIGRSAIKYRISDYLDWQYEDIDKNLLKRFTGLFGIGDWSIDETVEVYHIEITGANSPNVVCYNVPPFKSYIFLNSAPYEKKQVFKKFCLLHELGHASLHFTTTSAFSQHSNKLYLTLIVFLAILCSVHTFKGVFFGITVLLFLLSQIEKFIVVNTQKVNDECCADELAISYLNSKERKALREIFIKYPAEDPSLSDIQNKVRHQTLLKNLELMIESEDNQDTVLDHVHSRIFKPGFILLFITCGLVSALAFYTVPISGYFTLGLFIATVISVLVFCFYHLVIDVFHRHITGRLSEWNRADV